MAFFKVISLLCTGLLILSVAEGASLSSPSADALLQMLDLPGPGGRKVDPPQVMLELYSRASQSSPDTQLPYGATTVTAVPALVERDEEYQFVLPEPHREEEVVGVEFHMRHGHLQHYSALSHRGLALQVEARIYGTDSSTSQMLSDPSPGWYKFSLNASDVTAFYNQKDSNLKFPLTIHTRFTTNNGKTVNLKHHHRKTSSKQSSLLIIFSRKRNAAADTNPADVLRYQDDTGLNTHRVKRSLFNDMSQSSNSSGSSSAPNECYKRSLRINFSHIGWSSWIVAPTSFDAFYCSGSCGFPLGQDMNPTNHAVVQSVAKLLINENLPSPHCVPSSYSSLSILYIDEFANVVLKNYKEMIADSCGCH